jgi:hypothetical protein
MARSQTRFIKLYWNSVRLITGLSLVLCSHSIALSAWANQPLGHEIRIAQAQLTTDQIPMSRLSDARKLEYGDRVNGRLNVSSIRHQGRRFAIYQFEGEEGQLARINLVGGVASTQSPNQLQTGNLLINPVVILLDPEGKIIAQQPEETNVANALIRMNLPITGTYTIFVTSAAAGGGGQYTLTLQNPEEGN